MRIIGREEECALLEQLKESKSAEFLAIYGRRRVGKTHLVREYFKKDIVLELAHRHIEQIKQALGITNVDTIHASWLHRPNKTWPTGAQIDLLLDRADNTINILEAKFSQGSFAIDKKYAGELRQKVQVFSDVTATRKNLFLTFLTTHGLTHNTYAKELVPNSITVDVLFSKIL